MILAKAIAVTSIALIGGAGGQPSRPVPPEFRSQAQKSSLSPHQIRAFYTHRLSHNAVITRLDVYVDGHQLDGKTTSRWSAVLGGYDVLVDVLAPGTRLRYRLANVGSQDRRVRIVTQWKLTP